ncbi:nickel transporter [Pantoea sp. Mb-10]|uniref:nickel/cobalt transporter n=1 Tax=unclassified Pantoea TaxID=2630326 RepID=UPI001E5F2107|nr:MULTISPECIES: nickel transporter [unclassified Pantoea]MCE0491300.1 nickel transporter [Pantoea sp. Mb-10]MCE0502789.1 nickel transporter [Pantoea sp. Pb-8]
MTHVKRRFSVLLGALVIAVFLLLTNGSAFLACALQVQIQLHRLLVTHLLQLNSGQLAAGGWLAGVTFIYGILHAVGPGHGKFIVSSWLSTHQPPRGIALCVPLLGSLLQGVSAIAFVFILAIGFNLTTGDLSQSRWYLEKASALFIATLGVMMIINALRAPMHQHHDHGHCGHSHGVTASLNDSWRTWLGIIIATGVRPCSGALTVLLFASVIGITRWGVFAVMTMACGTGITLVTLAWFVRHFRQRAGELWLSDTSPKVQKTLTCLRVVGGVLLMLFALVLFLTVVPVSPNGDYIAAGC